MVEGQGLSAVRFDYIQSQPGPHRVPLLLAEGGIQNPRQVALSALFLSSSIISRQEGPEASSLPPAVSLSLPWSHFPTKQLVVFLQHSLKKPVVQLQSSEQRFPPPSAVPRGRGGRCVGRGGADAAERKETVPSFLPSVCKFFIFIWATRRPETFPFQSHCESLRGADAAGLPAVLFCNG